MSVIDRISPEVLSPVPSAAPVDMAKQRLMALPAEERARAIAALHALIEGVAEEEELLSGDYQAGACRELLAIYRAHGPNLSFAGRAGHALAVAMGTVWDRLKAELGEEEGQRVSVAALGESLDRYRESRHGR